MKKSFFAAAIIMVGIMSGCGQQAIQTNTTQTNESTVKIGFIGPLSGDQAIIGEENLRGVQIAVDEVNKRGGVNGTQVELLIQDDQFNEKETLNAYTKLVQTEGVDYVFAATYGGFLSLPEQAVRDNVIVIETLDTSEELAGIGENMFAIGIYDESIGFAIADHLNALGAQHVGAIILQDPFTALVEGALKSRFLGEMNVEYYAPDTRDYRTALTKFSKKEVLLVIGWEEAGRIVKQARELGIDAPIVGIDTMASEDFRTNTGGNYDGLHFTFWQGAQSNKAYTGLLRAYQEKFNKEPENVVFLSTGYDAANILMQSLQGCKDKIGCVKGNLRSVRGYQGAAGSITMDEDQITRSVRETIHRYEGEEIVPAT